jgi:hypothetical protein
LLRKPGEFHLISKLLVCVTVWSLVFPHALVPRAYGEAAVATPGNDNGANSSGSGGGSGANNASGSGSATPATTTPPVKSVEEICSNVRNPPNGNPPGYYSDTVTQLCNGMDEADHRASQENKLGNYYMVAAALCALMCVMGKQMGMGESTGSMVCMMTIMALGIMETQMSNEKSKSSVTVPPPPAAAGATGSGSAWRWVPGHLRLALSVVLSPIRQAEA